MTNPTAAVGGINAGGRLELIVTPTEGATVVDEDELERLRHRNASGSLSSHDYEEMSTSSASLRSTPTCPSHTLHLAHSPRLAVDFEGNRRHPAIGINPGTMRETRTSLNTRRETSNIYPR